MAVRYSADLLLHLRESPLCTRPNNLPPTEEWMGPPPEQIRTQTTKPGIERPRTNDSSLLDQAGRRSGLDRHMSRNTANPEDIVFGPPRMAFASARGNKSLDNDKAPKDADPHGRVGLRARGDNDGDRFRDGRSNPLRRRGDGDPDSDGWNTVKPRKSFGAEGAERFHGKMGGNFRDDRRQARDNRDDRETTRDRHGRGFDGATKDKDATENDNARPRNGIGRNKADNWRAAEGNDAPPMPEKRDQKDQRDRDRTKSWRERDRDHEPSDDRGAGRTNDRRWGRERDQRTEREPEWLDEPVVEPREAHTQQDFQKWMEQMKKAKGGSSNAKAVEEAPVEAAKSAPIAHVEVGPDKFFLAFGETGTSAEKTSPSGEQKDPAATKAKPGGKSSRFTSFFSQPQADSKSRTESSTPLAGPPANGPPLTAGQASSPGGLAALLEAAAPSGAPEEERQAFKQLLAKLQKASLTATPPAPSPFAAPPQGDLAEAKMSSMGSPESFQQYGGERRDGPHVRPPSQPPHHEIVAPRPQQQSARPEQLLQDLVGHHQRVSSQGSNNRTEANTARNNSNTEFLMNLMRMAPDARGQDQGRAPSQPQPQPQLQKPSSMPPFHDREPEFGGRENRNNERAMRQQAPPGFPMDEAFHNVERDHRQNQPTQILQRPPPHGMDQMPPGWMVGGGQMPPPQQRGPMLPPPGLAGGLGGLGGPGGPNRNMPMPPMFPPNFPPGAMPPPEAMGGMPPRNMPPPPPPPGFFNGPPHGFLPPGLGGFNGPPQGPEGFGGPPFEARGMPPAGGNGRNSNYGRP